MANYLPELPACQGCDPRVLTHSLTTSSQLSVCVCRVEMDRWMKLLFNGRTFSSMQNALEDADNWHIDNGQN